MSDYTDEALDRALGDADEMGRGLGSGLDLRGALPGMDDVEREFWLSPPNEATDLPALAAPVPGAAPAPAFNAGLIRPNSDAVGQPPQMAPGGAAAVGAQAVPAGAPGIPTQAPPVAAAPPLGAAVLPPQQAPGSAPGPGVPSVQYARAPGMTDFNGAADQMDALQKQHTQLAGDQVAAEFAAKQAASGRLTGAIGQELTELDKANADYQAARAQNEKLATQETHAWMERWDQAVREQPDPGHYWNSEGGGLRRSLWFASIMAQAIADRRHPERANMMMQMMMSEVDKDVQRQKEALATKRQGLMVEKGLMEGEQARRSKDMMEDRDMRLARIQSLGRYLEARAQAPGPEDLKAGYAAAAAKMGDESAKLAVDMYKEVRGSMDKVADRKHAEAMERYKQGQEWARQTRTLQHETSERLAKEDYDTSERLAGEAFKAGMAPVTAKNEALAKREADQTEIDPRATGLFIRDRATGKTRNIVVDKEQQAKAMSEATDAANEYKDYTTLAAAAKDEGNLQKLLQTNPAARAAAIKIAARNTKADFSRTTEVEFEKELDAGGGTFAAGSRGRQLITWLSGNNEAVQDFVAKEARDFQADAGRRIVGKYNAGAHLGPNEEVIFSPPNVEGQTPKTPTTDEALIRQGVTDLPPVREPTNVKQYEEALKDPEHHLPPLSRDASRAIEDVRNIAGWAAPTETHAGLTAKRIADLEDAAISNIEAGYPDALHSGAPTIPEGERKAAANRVSLEADRAIDEARKHEERLILGTDRFNGGMDRYNHDRFMKAAQREGFDTSQASVKSDLEELFKLAQDPDFVNRVRQNAQDRDWHQGRYAR